MVTGGAGDSLYQFSAPDSYEGGLDNDSAVATYVNTASGQVKETVNWSRVRFTGYIVLSVRSTPAPRGGPSTLAVRALTEGGTEVDHFTLTRRAS